MTAMVFEDWSEERQMNAWYFSFQGRVHGPFGTETEADHALDAYMSDYYLGDDFEPMDPAEVEEIEAQFKADEAAGLVEPISPERDKRQRELLKELLKRYKTGTLGCCEHGFCDWCPKGCFRGVTR